MRCLCNQNKASPRHLSHWSAGQVSFMWLFTLALFCVNVEFPVFDFTPISQQRRGGGLCWSGLLSKCWDLLPCLPSLRFVPPLPTQPAQPRPDSTPTVVPFPFAKDGDQRAFIVYCSSVMVWKQPSAGAFDICGHINQDCHTACLPSLLPPNPTGSCPCPSPQPLLPTSSLLSLTWMCVIVSSSSDSSLNWMHSS